VLGKTAARHTSQEFVAFLADLVINQPRGQEIHPIADNLSAYKTSRVKQFFASDTRHHSDADQKLYVIHNLSELDLNLTAAGFTAAAAGHSHKAAIGKCGKVLYVNPGNAGPRRLPLA
jgi:hypothetical protein